MTEPEDPWAPPPAGWQPSPGAPGSNAPLSPPAPPPPPYGAPPGWQPQGQPSRGWQPQGQPPPYGWTPPYAPPRNTNGFAIASLVCGVAGLIIPILGGILGIVFGIVALTQTRDGREGGRGLAIAGIAVGAATFLLWLALIVGAVATSSGTSNGSSTVAPHRVTIMGL